MTAPRQKDPKKVEAGRKGAAARKTKQDQLHAQLLEAKAALKQTPEPRESVALTEPSVALTPSEEERQKERVRGIDWAPWIIGGAGLTVLWYYSSKPGPKPEKNQHPGAPSI